jgi:hypothetical protein
MTDNPSRELTTKPIAETERSAPKRVSGRLKAALDVMIFEGKPWNEAALQVKYSTRSMRLSMQKTHVMKYLRRQRGVYLAQMSGENIRAMKTVRDQQSNPAASVQAARALEALGIEASGGPGGGALAGGPRAGWVINLGDDPAPTAGLVIVVNHPPAPPAPTHEPGLTIDVTPNRRPQDE